MSAFDKKKPRIKPQLTWSIFLWGVVDMVGMALFSVGIVYFLHGPGAIFKSFPTTGAEAGAMIAVGAGIMIYAAGNILREMMKQPHMMDPGDDKSR
jgi:hypothetical protein